MSMRAGLVSLLTGESTISAIVGSRVFVNKAPQGQPFPYIIITQISSEDFKAIDGTGEARAVDFDIDCKAEQSIEAADLGDKVREFIQDYTGAAGAEYIRAVLLNDQSEDFEPPTDGSDVGVHTSLVDITVQWWPGVTS